MKIKNLTVCYEQLAILEDFSLELPDQGIICFLHLPEPENHPSAGVVRADSGTKRDD